MKKIIERLHQFLDRIVSKLAGETPPAAPKMEAVDEPPQQKFESKPEEKPNLKKFKDVAPEDFKPFDSEPNMEELIAPPGRRPRGKVSPHFVAKPVAGQMAGIKTRKKGESADNNKIVQNETNDTIYSERNEIVKVIYDRYAKFGDKVASAVLSKSFLPNGLQIILSKLEIESLGTPLADHDQVVDWIDEHGTEEFCKKMKIRM